MNSGRPRRILWALPIALIAIGAAIASSATAGPAHFVQFGSRLNPSIQPSNSISSVPCTHQDPGKPCTQVEYEAYVHSATINPIAGARAPKNGTLVKVRLIAGDSGHFRLQTANVRKVNGVYQGRVVQNGPVIHYTGQGGVDNGGPYKVETFKVNVPLHKGDFLATNSRFASFFRCSSGGDNTLLWEPPLLKGGGFKDAKSTDGCWMLIQGVERY